MSTQPHAPARLASEDVIINAPMSFVGSAQRIVRIRRHAPGGWKLIAVTLLAILLVGTAWAIVTAWYLTWGFLLVPYRLLRRGARKRKAEAMRHRELMGTIQGSSAGSAAAIVTAMTSPQAAARPEAPPSPAELVADADREVVTAELREHMIAGRLTADEFEQRLASTHRARTRADLDAARIDLPLAGSPVA
jgi:hypothetical protein